jgi:hypothetical protein
MGLIAPPISREMRISYRPRMNLSLLVAAIAAEVLVVLAVLTYAGIHLPIPLPTVGIGVSALFICAIAAVFHFRRTEPVRETTRKVTWDTGIH